MTISCDGSGMLPASDHDDVPEAVARFLPCVTPGSWVEQASRQQELLLIDHANCEKKAAATAMNLLYRYVDCAELLTKMSQLAREELLHFEQVVSIMQERGIAYRRLDASRYASGLRRHLRGDREGGLIDLLIVGAFVEARSCERFARLIPVLDAELARFYGNLLRAEARHFEDYLALARRYAREDDVDARIELFAGVERDLVLSTDHQFRFHSGVPVSAAVA